MRNMTHGGTPKALLLASIVPSVDGSNKPLPVPVAILAGVPDLTVLVSNAENTENSQLPEAAACNVTVLLSAAPGKIVYRACGQGRG